jgi:hypothetical protein
VSWWNPVSWAEDAWNGIAGVSQDVGKWVIKYVKEAINDVESDLNDWVADLGGILTDAEILLDEAFADAVTAVDWISAEGSHLLDDATSAAEGLVSSAVADLESAGGAIKSGAEAVVAGFERDVLDPAISGVETAIDSVESGLSRTIDSVADNLYGLASSVADRFANAYTDIEHYADEGVATLERDVVDPIASDLSALEALAVTTASDAWHDTVAAVRLVEECADWLEMFALHALSDIENLPAEIAARLSPEAVADYVQNELAGDVATAKAFVEEWAGS